MRCATVTICTVTILTVVIHTLMILTLTILTVTIPPASSPWGCLPGSAVPRVDAERSQGTARGASASLQRKWQQRSWILPILLEASLMFFHWLQVLRGVKFLLQSQAKRTVWRRPQHPPVGAAGASRPGTRVVRLHLGMSSAVLGTSGLSDIDKPEGD